MWSDAARDDLRTHRARRGWSNCAGLAGGACTSGAGAGRDAQEQDVEVRVGYSNIIRRGQDREGSGRVTVRNRESSP